MALDSTGPTQAVLSPQMTLYHNCICVFPCIWLHFILFYELINEFRWVTDVYKKIFLFLTSKIIRKYWLSNGYFNWIFVLSNDPGLSIMEIKKDKNVKWASKASVITPGFEEADSLTGSLLRVSNDNSLSKMDQDERR